MGGCNRPRLPVATASLFGNAFLKYLSLSEFWRGATCRLRRRKKRSSCRAVVTVTAAEQREVKELGLNTPSPRTLGHG